MICCGPNIQYKDLLKILNILKQHNIKDIYIVPLEYIQRKIQNNKVTYNLDFPNIEIKSSNHISLKPASNDDEKFADKFFTYFHKYRMKSPARYPVIKCPLDIQQYWLNRVIKNLNCYSHNDFILETKKQKYKIKQTTPGYELYMLFKKFEEIPPPPSAPPGEK